MGLGPYVSGSLRLLESGLGGIWSGWEPRAVCGNSLTVLSPAFQYHSREKLRAASRNSLALSDSCLSICDIQHGSKAAKHRRISCWLAQQISYSKESADCIPQFSEDFSLAV